MTSSGRLGNNIPACARLKISSRTAFVLRCEVRDRGERFQTHFLVLCLALITLFLQVSNTLDVRFSSSLACSPWCLEGVAGFSVSVPLLWRWIFFYIKRLKELPSR